MIIFQNCPQPLVVFYEVVNNFLEFFCGRNIGNTVGFWTSLNLCSTDILCTSDLPHPIYVMVVVLDWTVKKRNNGKVKNIVLSHHPISNSKETVSVLHIVWKFMCVRVTSFILKCLIMSEHHFWGMYYNTGLLSAKVVQYLHFLDFLFLEILVHYMLKYIFITLKKYDFLFVKLNFTLLFFYEPTNSEIHIKNFTGHTP